MLTQYARRDPRALLRLLLNDVFLWALGKAVANPPPSIPPKRILIANPAHLGDAIITLATINTIKSYWPDTEIDVLCGSWSNIIFSDHPSIADTYAIDFPELNRSPHSLWHKKDQFNASKEKTLSAIYLKNYDIIAIAYLYEPSCIPFLRQIFPKTYMIGFDSAGHSALLDHKTGPDFERHEVINQLSLFSPWITINPDPYHHSAHLPRAIRPAVLDQLNSSPYIVIHPGTGNPAKEWPITHWNRLLQNLKERNYGIVLTGQGAREEQIATALDHDNIDVNLVGKLSFQEFTVTIAEALYIITVDSVSAHVAASSETPGIVISTGIANINSWHPLYRGIKTLTLPMPCSPCHTRPCSSRPCITQITPERVMQSFLEHC